MIDAKRNKKHEPLGATLEALAAFCRLAKPLSHSEQMGWLVGAVGIEPRPPTEPLQVTDFTGPLCL